MFAACLCQLLLCEGELRWLYTGRNGYVARKRGAAEKELIERHFMEAALANPQNTTRRVAFVQHKEGEDGMGCRWY